MNDWLQVRVARKAREADDIASFSLAPVEGEALPAYEAGAHIDVKLPDGTVRQYSLCGPATETDRYTLGVLREAGGRGGSTQMHDVVQEGDLLEISKPRNLFPLVPQKRAILFAGGIGVTPILAMADSLAQEDVPFEVHYCTRSTKRAAFAEWLQALVLTDCAWLHFDDQPETALDATAILSQPDPDTHLYVCGPDGFMDHVIDTARAAGWAESNIHFERFSAAPADEAAQGSFEIEIEGTGQLVLVAPGQPAIEALAEAGIEIPISCEQGICGTCLTDVVSGVPDHQDMFLSDEEKAANDCFTPCCSRALTPRLTIRI